MADTLFPAVDMPDFTKEDSSRGKYYPSVFFDFEKGDLLLDGAHRIKPSSGKEAWMQWCQKILATQRGAFLAYSTQIGTEFDELVQTKGRQTREDEIEETIKEALMVHPCTEFVRDFSFEHDEDECFVTFKIKGYGWEEEVFSTIVTDGS